MTKIKPCPPDLAGLRELNKVEDLFTALIEKEVLKASYTKYVKTLFKQARSYLATSI